MHQHNEIYLLPSLVCSRAHAIEECVLPLEVQWDSLVDLTGDVAILDLNQSLLSGLHIPRILRRVNG